MTTELFAPAALAPEDVRAATGFPDRAPRIVDIINLSSSADTLLRDRVLAMRAAGIDNRILCMDGPYVPAMRAAGIPVGTVPLPRGADPARLARSFLAIASYLRRERIDLVHTHCSVPGAVGRLAAWAARVPAIVHTVHGFHFHEGTAPLPRAGYVLLERVCGAVTDVLLSQTRGDMDQALRHRIVPAARLRHIGNGIDIGRFTPRRPGTADAPGARPSGTFTVICVARMEPVKNHRLLFEAVRRLDPRVPLRLQLVGGGALRAEYEALCGEWGIADRVAFLGYRDDVPELVAAADAAVLTSFKEGIPRAALEAAACGIPMVATDVPGTREAVVHGETGFLVPPGDPGALALRLCALYADPALRERLGARARVLAEQSFDERAIVRALMEVYAAQLGAVSAPAGARS